MLIAGLLIIISILIAQATAGALVAVRMTRKYNDLANKTSDFLSQPSENEPSDFNKLIDQVANLFADRYRVAILAADRGAHGAAQRDINRGLQEIAAEEHPAFALAQSLPRNLRKNPLAEAGLNILINKLVTGGVSNGGSKSGFSGGNHPNQTKFNL